MATFLKCDGCGKELAAETRTLVKVAMTVTTASGRDFVPVPPRRDALEHYDCCPACLRRLEQAIDPRNFAQKDLESDLAAHLADHGAPVTRRAA